MSYLRKYKPLNLWVAKQVENTFSNHIMVSDKLMVSPDDFSIFLSTDRNRKSPDQSIPFNELTKALFQLNEYAVKARQQNSIINKRTLVLDNEATEQLNKLKYFDKIYNVEQAINENHKVINAVIENILDRLVKANKRIMLEPAEVEKELEFLCKKLNYNISKDNKLVKSEKPVTTSLNSQEPSNQSRVVEAISHLSRDWNSNFSKETETLVDYVLERIESCKFSDNKKTLILVPGPGVGQIPYSIAKQFPQYQVESIEWSALMYLCNEFALNYNKDIKIRPFAQYYSSQTSETNQTRSFTIPLSKVQKLDNLSVKYGDFRKYTSNIGNEYDNIVICTVYFMDTAENIFEYLQKIENVNIQRNNDATQTINWINIGPLKYGTRPIVQLTAEELKKLRKIRGWKDIHEETVKDYNAGLNGYLTDYESLYQGYYGLVKFHSRYKK